MGSDRIVLNPITRRAFIRASGYAALSTYLAACAPVAPAPTPTPATTPGVTPGPTPGPTPPSVGGILRVALGDGRAGDTLDPNQQVNFFMPPVVASMYDTITRLDQGFQPQPHLAESWEPSDDARTWIIRLRRDVEFHDGSPMTAADAVWSLRRAMHPESGTPLVTLLGDIVSPDNIRAVDEHTIQFDLDVPFVFLPLHLSTRYTKVLKEDTPDDQILTNPNGTGPFRFGEFVPGQSFTAMRNDNYWQEGKPHVEELSIINIPESASKLEALRTGQADFIDNIGFAIGRQLDAEAGVEPVVFQDAAWHPLILDLNVEPFNNPDVVRAMKLAIDRQQVIDRVYAGFANLGYDSIIPASDPYFPDAIAPPAYDLDAARELLRGAGYANGLRLPFPLITVFGFDTDNNAAVHQELLAEAGFQFDIRQGGPTFWDVVWLNEPFYLPDWNRRHAAEGFPVIFSCEGAWNQTNFCDPNLDALIVDAASTTDFEEQKRLYGEIIRTLIENDGTILSAYSPRLHARRESAEELILTYTEFMNFEDVRLT